MIFMQLSIEIDTNWDLLSNPTSSSTVSQLQAKFGFGVCEDITYALTLTPNQCSFVSIAASTKTQYSSTIPGVTVVVDVYAPDSPTLYSLFSTLQTQATTPESLLKSGFATQSVPSSTTSVTMTVSPQATTSVSSSSGGPFLSMGIFIALAVGAVLLIALDH